MIVNLDVVDDWEDFGADENTEKVEKKEENFEVKTSTTVDSKGQVETKKTTKKEEKVEKVEEGPEISNFDIYG